jgi:Cu/Ag efflux protein CusF
LPILVNGALHDGVIRVSRLLRERSSNGTIVTNSFIAEDRPLKDITRGYLLDSAHAATGYGYVVNSCGGYEYFPFDRKGQDRIRELVTRSSKADRIKFVIKGFDFWRGRTTKVTSAKEDLAPEAAPAETTVNGLVVSRSFYLQNKLQFSKLPFNLTRDSLLAPASVASGYGIAYKPCCRFGFYRTDDAGRAQLASLVKNSTSADNIKVIAKGVLDLDFIKITSVEEDTSAGPAASYPLKGQIVDLVSAESSLLIKHEAIPGFMAAMTMSFRVEPKVLQTAKKGQNVTATLRVKNDDFWLEDVKFLP